MMNFGRTNKSLIDYIAAKAKGFLKAKPSAKIISISQNDNGNYCHEVDS